MGAVAKRPAPGRRALPGIAGWTSSCTQHANGRITLMHEISMACPFEPLATMEVCVQAHHLLELKRASPISVSRKLIPWPHTRQRHHRRGHNMVASLLPTSADLRALPALLANGPSMGTGLRLMSRSKLFVTTNISQAPSQAHVGEPCEEHVSSTIEVCDSRSSEQE